MTVRAEEAGTILLEGRCPVEDADTLARLLSSDPSAMVDWHACEYAHTAVIQILLAVRPEMRGSPPGPSLRNWIEPMLADDNR